MLTMLVLKPNCSSVFFPQHPLLLGVVKPTPMLIYFNFTEFNFKLIFLVKCYFCWTKKKKWTENWDWLLLHPRYTLIYTLYPPYFENHYCNISFALFYRNRQRSWDFKTFSSCHSFLTGCLWLFISTVAFYVCAGNINKQIRTVVKMSSYNGGENWYFGTNCTWIFSLNWKTRWR